MENHLARPEILMAMGGKEGIEIRYSKTLDQEMLYLAKPITGTNKIIGVVRLSVPMNQLEMITSQIIRSTILRSLVITGLISPFSYSDHQSILTPPPGSDPGRTFHQRREIMQSTSFTSPRMNWASCLVRLIR